MQYITTRITADGADGYRAGPGRYRLVVARACPWANRAIIVRRLLGLEKALPTARRPGRRRPASRFPRATGRSPRRPDRE
jgi:glutathionyl-hydroquinone reductase